MCCRRSRRSCLLKAQPEASHAVLLWWLWLPFGHLIAHCSCAVQQRHPQRAEVLFILVYPVYCRDNHHNAYRPRSARTGLEVLTSLCVRVSGGIWTIPSTAGGYSRSRFGSIFQTLAAFTLAPAAPIPTPVFCSPGDWTSRLVRCTRWHLSAAGLEDVTLSV